MIYLDNASTYHPKSSRIAGAIQDYLTKTVSSPGRGGHKQAKLAADILMKSKQLACDFFNGVDPQKFHFCPNATSGLNLVIQGFLKNGDRVVTTVLEHNSVLRPLKKLSEEKNIQVELVPCDKSGEIDPNDVIKHIKSGTRLVILNHASNVVGTVLDIKPILKYCQMKQIATLVDTSQTAGVIDIDLAEMPMDFMVATGHKALGGPSGTGIIYAKRIDQLTPVLVGGTGGNSLSIWHPQNSDTIIEAGTPNYLGIAALGAAIEELIEMKEIRKSAKEINLLRYFVESFKNDPDILFYGPQNWQQQVPILSFNIRGMTPQEVMARLDDEYDIIVRAGIQCAPFAHQMLGTAPYGTVRISLSHATTQSEIEKLISAVKNLTKEKSVSLQKAL